MYTSNQIADFIIFRLTSEDNARIDNLKLQKLLYYTQAWHLAFYDNQPLFDGKFQAWIHGPVNREVYDRFKERKFLYSLINFQDIQNLDSISEISQPHQLHINSILEAYSPYSGNELEEMTHREEPWIEARKGYSPIQRCEVTIDEKLMGDYYRKRLPNE